MLIFALEAGNRPLEALKVAQMGSATEMQNLRDGTGQACFDASQGSFASSTLSFSSCLVK